MPVISTRMLRSPRSIIPPRSKKHYTPEGCGRPTLKPRRGPVDGGGRGHHAGHRKVSLHPLPARLTHAAPPLRVTEQCAHCRGQRRGVVDRHEQPGHSVFDRVHMPCHTRGHHCQTAGHRFKQTEWEAFPPRSRNVKIDCGHAAGRIRDEAGEPDTICDLQVTSESLKPPKLRPIANYEEPGLTQL